MVSPIYIGCESTYFSLNTFLINLSTINSDLSKSWIKESSLHWVVGGALGTLLLTILIYRWKFELVLYFFSIEEITNTFFDGYQSNSSYSRILWHSWSSPLVGGCVMNPQVDTSILIGVNRSSDASIPIFLCGLAGSSHIWIPKFRHWFGLSVIFPSYFWTTSLVPAWACGSERNTSVFPMLGVTGSRPHFRKPENCRKGRLQMFRPTRSSEFSRCWVMVSCGVLVQKN